MNNAILRVPRPENEPVKEYAPGSKARSSLESRLDEMASESIDVGPIINGETRRTGETSTISPPHAHQEELGTLHGARTKDVEDAIEASLEARKAWAQMPWEERAAIFLRAAEMLAGPWRNTLNAATMLGQSKSVHQAEIDAACELIDFLRYNAYFMEEMYTEQPCSSKGIWNRMQYRALEGFVLAVTPFNFTAIQGNLPSAPAMMGNVVLWKPSSTSVYSAYYTYRLFEEAGLPPGVINMLPGDGPTVGNPAISSPHFAGLHFTGSTATFEHLWSSIGNNLSSYNSYPRIVGETGGKDFVVAHPSARTDQVAAALVRGSFEFQGQKCSASSRVYLPASLWDEIRDNALEQLSTVKMGPVDDFSNYVNAVIDKASFDKIAGYIDHAKQSEDADIIQGGTYDDSEGYFIEPTIIKTRDPRYKSMKEEIFGPVLTVYVYQDDEFEETLSLVDQTSPYALTGAIFSRDRTAVQVALDKLENSAGNFYINDKPTGAVVGQQPFGGARKSGTNDKAGSKLNLLRWVSARSIKENLSPPSHYRYPFLGPEIAKEEEKKELAPSR